MEDLKNDDYYSQIQRNKRFEEHQDKMRRQAGNNFLVTTSVVILFGLIMFFADRCTAQVFMTEPIGLGSRYVMVQAELDPMGSIDKEGINTVISVMVKGWDDVPIEVGIGVQSVFTPIYVQDGYTVNNDGDWGLDYIDAQIQVQGISNLGDRIQLLYGMHGGYLWRQTGTGFIYGFMATSRIWFGRARKIGFVISYAYDYREFKEFRLNGRGGIIWRL